MSSDRHAGRAARTAERLVDGDEMIARTHETIAAELTKGKVEIPRGGRWHDRAVARLLDRLHLR